MIAYISKKMKNKIKVPAGFFSQKSLNISYYIKINSVFLLKTDTVSQITTFKSVSYNHYSHLLITDAKKNIIL